MAEFTAKIETTPPNQITLTRDEAGVIHLGGNYDVRLGDTIIRSEHHTASGVDPQIWDALIALLDGKHAEYIERTRDKTATVDERIDP